MPGLVIGVTAAVLVIIGVGCSDSASHPTLSQFPTSPSPVPTPTPTSTCSYSVIPVAAERTPGSAVLELEWRSRNPGYAHYAGFLEVVTTSSCSWVVTGPDGGPYAEWLHGDDLILSYEGDHRRARGVEPTSGTGNGRIHIEIGESGRLLDRSAELRIGISRTPSSHSLSGDAVIRVHQPIGHYD